MKRNRRAEREARAAATRRKSVTAPDERRASLVVAVCIGLIALTWFVFAQVLGHDFVNYDDQVYVLERPEVNAGLTLSGIGWVFTHVHASNWHPLTSIAHMLDCTMFGLKPAGHHLTSLVLHTAAVVLLFVVLRQLTGAFWRSAFVAAVFAIHPLRVESVAWVAERKDVLSGVFFLLTLMAYRAYVRQQTIGRYVVTAAVFTLGLLSKPMLVTVPFVLLLLDYWPMKRETSAGRLILEKLPLVLLSVGASIATMLAQTGALIAVEQLPLPVRISNALHAYVIYIWQMIWPQGLAVFYPIRYDRPAWQLVLAFVLLLAVTAAAWVFRKQRPYLLTGWFWYVGMLVPVIGLVQVGSQAHADRYTYLPHIGLYVIIAWAFAELAASWKYRVHITAALVAIVIAALALSSHAQAAVWRDAEKLWNHALVVTSRNNVAHNVYAQFLVAKNRLEEAVPHYERALAIRPNDPDTHNRVGLILFRLGRANDGFAHWKAALKIDPENLNAQSNVAWILATAPSSTVRDGRRAVEFAQNVIARSGTRSPLLLRTLAAAHAEAGQFREAIAVAEEALRLAEASGESGLAADLRANLSDYRLDLPLRDRTLADIE